MTHARRRLKSGTWLLALAHPASALAMSCHLISAGEFNFGAYDALSPVPLDVQATYSIQCIPDFAGENLKLQLILLSSGRDADRLQSAATGKSLNFGLYLDPERRNPIDAQTRIEISDRLMTPREFPLTIYGRIPARQNRAAGLYTRSISFILNY